MLDVLPNCVLDQPKGDVLRDGVWWTEVFCGNCGKDGVMVPRQETQGTGKTFAFRLCTPCFETYGVPEGVMAVPDELFFAEVAAAQLEHAGRYLTEPELVELLADGNSWLSKLARDRYTQFGGH